MVPLSELPDPGVRDVPRYSRRAFPAYRFVPGLQPHPTRDRRGHSFEPTPTLNRHARWRVEDWRTLDDWLYGVDLFNRFYFWEAHEAWEGLWAAAERDTPPSLLLQGLIQIAAALLKLHMGVTVGALTLSAGGLEKLRRVAAAQPALLGLDVPEVVERFADFFAPLQRGAPLRVGPDVPVLRLALS